jgi:tripartite-type tricarboxylate transporter receptor subunit TctC
MAWLHNVLRVRLCALLLALVSITSTSAFAADAYPSHQIRLIVPFEAGTYTDVVARMIATRLSQRLGGTVFVDNRPGAGGNIGTQQAAIAAPDGYTLLFTSIATHGINPSLYKNLSYDAQRDFIPLSLVMKVPNVVVVTPALPVKTLGDLANYARANPGKLSFASAGIGTSQHMTGELFNMLEKVKIQHIPYRGSQGALNDLFAGRVQVSFQNLPSVLPYINEGRLRALAITSDTRNPLAPTIPTAAEAGLPGFVATSWSGAFVRTGTPAPIASRLTREIQEIVRSPEMQDFFGKGGVLPVGSTSEEFRSFIATEIPKWKQVVTSSGASLE